MGCINTLDCVIDIATRGQAKDQRPGLCHQHRSSGIKGGSMLLIMSLTLPQRGLGRIDAPDRLVGNLVGNLVKFHISIYSGPLHKYPIKEGFFTSWGVKSNKKPCWKNHRLTMGIFLLPYEAYNTTTMV